MCELVQKFVSAETKKLKEENAVKDAKIEEMAEELLRTKTLLQQKNQK